MSDDQLNEEEIFQAAYDLESPGARMDYLRQVCRDGDQVERIVALLKEGAPEASFLEHGPAALRESNSVSSEIPQQIGDFEILGHLGRGGMGIVYRARQRSLNRQVALKVLSTGFGLTTKAVMRFKREAEAAAKLHHTNIVPIYSTGDENRIPYYAMELVDGPSLDQVIRQLRQDTELAPNGSLDSTDDGMCEEQPAVPDWVAATIGCQAPQSDNNVTSSTSVNSDSASSLSSSGSYFDNVAGMMAGVADALAHAHDHGVIHRDIKPANLLLSSDGRISINDFGLARILEQPGMTMTGEFMGSPMYMSPEQIAAGRLPLDHRTDIYSLGATLYQILTLEPPFAGQQRDQVLSQIIHKEPASLRSINNKIPKDLETICLKAMEKDPERRYQTADQMAVDLRCFVNRHAISARRIGPLERASRWVRKNKALAAMACLTLVVGISATGFVYRTHVERLSQEELHREEKIIEAQEEALSEAMNGNGKAALEHISRAEKLGASVSWQLMLLGQLDLFNGKPEDALIKLEAVADQNDHSVMAQSMLAEAHLANGDFGAYADSLGQVENLSPKLPEDHLFKGWAIRLFTPEKALEEIDEAIRIGPPGFTLAKVLRASVRVNQAQDTGNLTLVDSALTDVKFLSQDLVSPLLSEVRLDALLTAHQIFQRKGDSAMALERLGEAKSAVDELANSPTYLYGNKDRLIYYALTEDFDAMAKVMKDVVKNGNSGYIVQPYAAAFYQAGRSRIQEALGQLKNMTQENPNVAIATCVLLMDDSKKRKDARNTFRDLVEKTPDNSSSTFDGLHFLILGKSASKSPTIGLKHYDRDISEYMSGGINEDELLSRADGSEFKLQMSYFSIGTRQLAAGERPQARKSFKKCAESPYFNWGTSMWSRAFVARMDDPDWPEWLPAKPVSIEAK